MFGRRVEYFEQWLAHPGADDPFWDSRRATTGIGGIRAGQWRELADWPPPEVRTQPWHLHGDGTLALDPADGAAVSSFRYDPADPTPSVGGPSVNARAAGPRRNDALEARADVLVFTSAALSEPLEVMGPVGIGLRVRGSGPHFDIEVGGPAVLSLPTAFVS